MTSVAKTGRRAFSRSIIFFRRRRRKRRSEEGRRRRRRRRNSGRHTCKKPIMDSLSPEVGATKCKRATMDS